MSTEILKYKDFVKQFDKTNSKDLNPKAFLTGQKENTESGFDYKGYFKDLPEITNDDSRMIKIFLGFLPGGKFEHQKINLCKLKLFDDSLFCKDNANIPRNEMPQLTTENNGHESSLVPQLLDFLKSKGIKVTKEKIEPEKLKATQNEIDSHRVMKRVYALIETHGQVKGHTAPIIVSSNNYVLDGHHKFIAQYIYDFADGRHQYSLDILKAELPIRELLKLVQYGSDFCTKHKCIKPKKL